MWHVETLIAVDDDGNSVEIDEDVIVVSMLIKNGIRISRELPLDETPPCLSVAVDDLIKTLSD